MHLDVLAFGAHPDDVELFAGGTMAKLAASGYATGIVDLSRGELGTRGTAAARGREARVAARLLGVKTRENLGLPDGEIRVDAGARMKLIRILRRYRPTLVLVHHWEDRHPDHASTSTLVSQAAHHAGLAKIRTGQERYRPPCIMYFRLPIRLSPTLIVDVSEFAEQRIAAIRAYRSQLFDRDSREPSTYLSHPDFIANVETLMSYYGSLIGKTKGEGFYVEGVIEVHDPVEFSRNQIVQSFR